MKASLFLRSLLLCSLCGSSVAEVYDNSSDLPFTPGDGVVEISGKVNITTVGSTDTIMSDQVYEIKGIGKDTDSLMLTGISGELRILISDSEKVTIADLNELSVNKCAVYPAYFAFGGQFNSSTYVFNNIGKISYVHNTQVKSPSDTDDAGF